MKMAEWIRFLDEQRRRHGKTLFSVTELANVAGTDGHAVNVQIHRLKREGLLTQYARGIYGLPHEATAEQLVRAVDPFAYLTGHYALYQVQQVLQAPTQITCFTCRRHGRARKRTTPLGKLVFVCVKRPVYAPPEQGAVAEPEQALCDLTYMSCRAGLEPESQVTFRNLDRNRRERLDALMARYPAAVSRKIRSMLSRHLTDLGDR